MHKLPTESVLKEWRFGQTQAERLCAELLHIERYRSVDPQCPLGGPDGLKDVLCSRDQKKWIAACYFPTTKPSFKQIQKKFRNDFKGIKKNEANGLVFFVNQPLTPGERAKLTNLVKPYESELYHLERIRALLDSPKGYGLRLEYLGIAMVEEEQLSFWSMLKDDLTSQFINQERTLLDLNKKVDFLMKRTRAQGKDLTAIRSSLSVKKQFNPDSIHFPTSTLSIGNLFWIHRLLMDGAGFAYSEKGVFRTVNVWVGDPDPKTAGFTPIEPKQIFPKIKELLIQWRTDYSVLIHESPKKIISELAKFHHKFLSIHPFLDGNGRVARAILQQQTLELLNKRIEAIFTDDPKTYYECLRSADKGNLEPLITLISSCLE